MKPILAAFLLLLAAIASPAAALADAPHRIGPAPAGRPLRVITLAPSITEIVLELGARDRLVGVSRYDDAPDVQGLQRVGGYLDPSPEAILALRPDLLIAQPSPGNRAPVEQLSRLGVPVLVLPLGNVAEVLASVRAVGEALGDAPAGEAAARRIEAGLAEVRAISANRPRTRALVVYTWQPLVAAGPGSFADELLIIAGAENAAPKGGNAYPTLSAEAALVSDPAVVIDASGGHGAGTPLPGWSARLRKPASNALFRPGPRLVEAVRELAHLIHPELER